MTFDLQKSINGLLILLTICLGLLVGRLAADWLGMSLAPEEILTDTTTTEPVRVKTPRLQNFTTIGQRNLFDSNAVPVSIEQPSAADTAESKSQSTPAIRSDLKLLGTVSGGDSPLAVIQSGKETEVYRVDDTLPGNLTLVRVERDRATVQSAAGLETVLELAVEKISGQSGSRTSSVISRTDTSSAKIVELGENSWQIPREEAEKARSNLNALLKTARMVPKIENGTTTGFTIVSIQPGTFLDLLGLKVGDVLVQINAVELNSPEKALQIFQQVREANNLSLGLLRNGSRQTFEYTIE